MNPRLTLAGAALLALAAHAASAAPVEFNCYSPPVYLTKDDTRSRDRLQQSEEVFVLPVSLNADPPLGDIVVNPSQNGVCDVHLPVGAFFTQNVSWREAATGSDHAAYQALHLVGTGGANTNASDLIIKTTDAKTTGVAIVEFHLYFMYPRTAF